MIILGISAFYHDSAAAIIKDGEVIAAAQEERFTRIKHDSGFPAEAIRFCLKQAKITLADLDSTVFFEKPFLKFERILETYLSTAPKGFQSFKTAMPVWLHEKLFQKRILTDRFCALDNIEDRKSIHKKLLFSDHHLSHAASAFYPSPFEEAVVLCMDGVGEWASSSIWIGKGASLEIEKEILFPHSLGLLYSAFTSYLGFKVNSGEYKMMGLAPYGRPIYEDLILKYLVDVKDDGSFRLDMSYFDYMSGLTMTNEKFHDLFKTEPRAPEGEIAEFHMDVAASIQSVTEKILLKIVQSLAREHRGIKNLCLAGGVALNCVANGKILKSGLFENIWIQPAAGDSGGAVGAAFAAFYLHHKKERDVFFDQDSMKGGYLGPSFDQNDVTVRLSTLGAKFHVHDDVAEITAKALADQKIVGWFQGAMEYGPRALGARSILADPRSASMQKTLNLKVKFRESFRPFGPAVLYEHMSEWFDLEKPSPYMLLTAMVQPSKRTGGEDTGTGFERLRNARSQIPAATHVDYSARVQSVHAQTNPKFHELLSAFYKITECPAVLNTSFNVRGEPIVCSPEDAFTCFMGCDIDMLVIENCVLHKSEQDLTRINDHKAHFWND